VLYGTCDDLFIVWLLGDTSIKNCVWVQRSNINYKSAENSTFAITLRNSTFCSINKCTDCLWQQCQTVISWTEVCYISWYTKMTWWWMVLLFNICPVFVKNLVCYCVYCTRRRKTLISNRGRWSPLSLFRQVHLGVGKSENNLPSQGYELLQPGKQ